MTDDEAREQEEQGQPESQESEASGELSGEIPEEAGGDGDTPLGATDQHSDAPGPTGTG
ncbi:MAG TPA: hypothetical protein VNT32_10660 [Thermoleophilaceae bacterium]|nr:hypothetical protein [Thermoleophilaceae bacterium]